MSRSGYDFLLAKGFFSEDVDGLYCGDEPGYEKRKYYVQLDGGVNTSPKWSDVTYHSPQKFLRDLATKGYPDAMILKTKYLGKE